MEFPPASPTSPPSPVRRNVLLVSLVWTGAMVLSLGWNLYNHSHQVRELARAEAEAHLDKDFAFHLWAMTHQGEAALADGRALVTPLELLRRMKREYAERSGIQGHVTSLDVVNPENAPDPWARRQLERFQQGGRGMVEEEVILDGRPFLRVMRPALMEARCQPCHGNSGVAPGGVRGGVDVILPLERYRSLSRGTASTLTVSHGVLWLLGLAGIGVVGRRAERQHRERELARERLAEQEERVRLLLDSTAEGIYAVDTRSRCTLINQSAVRMLGFRCEDEILGRPVHDLIHHTRPDGTPYPWTECRANTAVREGRGVHVDDECFWRPDGTCFPVEYWAYPIRHEGRVVGSVVAFVDISERKEAERALRDLNEHLEQRVQEEVARSREKDMLLIQQSRHAVMGEMIGHIAHQWRQPLNALGLVLANIKDAHEHNELDEPALRELMGSGRRLVQKMSDTIDDFRNFFRPGRESRAFNLEDAVEETLGLMGASLAHSGIRVEKRIPAGLCVKGQPNEFSQVLLNLLSNAKDAIQARGASGGSVLLEACTEGEWVTVRVEDSGGGIPGEILPRVFEPYFTTKEKGTGVGLYMSRMIVENMGGGLSADNGERGAVLTLRLPAAACPDASSG